MFNIFSENKIIGQEPKKFSLYIIVLAIVLSIVAFLFLLDNSKNYRVENSIILIPKNEKSAKDSEHIIENMRFFPTKIGFYNKLIKDNLGTEDSSFGLSNDQREKMWNKEIKIEREGKSSIVKITLTGSDLEKTEEISEASISTLFSVMSFYYDIKNDIDLRIIEGPVVRTKINSWLLLAFLGIIIGTAISFLVNLISEFISKFILGKVKSTFKKPLLNFNFEWKKPAETKQETKTPEILEEIKKLEVRATPIQTANKRSSSPANFPGAPGNLSFIDEDYFRTNVLKGSKSAFETDPNPQGLSGIKTENQEIPQETPDVHREPTQEELKKRLNQLLKGEL